MTQAANEHIESQMSAGEIDEACKLMDIYASRLSMPTFAYLRRDGFKNGFRNNGLINGQMHETLSKCIYVGQRGSSGELNKYFICQVNMCPCRQMMRYARGSKTLSDTEYWDSPRVVLNVNVVALQRDVLKERRDHIRSEPTLLVEKGGRIA